MIRNAKPKSYLSDEKREALRREGGDNIVYIAESHAADKAGDDEAGWQWLSKAKLATKNPQKLKLWYGPDFIRQRGFDTSNADRDLGKDWLDR